MVRINRSRFKNSGEQKEKLIMIVLALLLIVFVCSVPLCSKAHAENVSSSMITIDARDGEILRGENINTRLPMASTTKIMTALLAVKSNKLYDIVTIKKESTNIEGSSIYLKEGEKYQLIDLVYGLMLRSGNDSADAIARYLGGSVEGFVKMMNDEVSRLKLKNTHFVNPHGLHDNNHYTSAYDLAMITKEALSNKDFAKISKTKVHKFVDSEGVTKVFVNKNKMLGSYDGTIGVKTGYTKKAGKCLVSAVERDGLKLITVVLNHPNMWGDSMSYFDSVFNGANNVLYAKAGSIVKSVKNSNGEIINLGVKEDINLKLLKNHSYSLHHKIIYNHFALNNVKKDEKIGKILIFNGKHLIFTQNIYNI